jgi:ParB family chromosome partitioning protein
MKLDFISLSQLSISKANMRGGKKPPDITGILPSVRARGVLVPILVRPNGSAETFEIVAGRRRFEAAMVVASENGGDGEPMPCAILDAGDDADAIEASLIENTARLDPDEVTRWETFTRLIKEGRSAKDISATFGLPELGVKRILALGNLCPRIRDLYRREQIDVATVRHLTLATKGQQKAWLALLDDPSSYCPTGHQLKAWLFGGASIATSAALFELEGYEGAIVADLFGEGGYFADADQFWAAQNAAIEARKAAYLADGWSDVVIVPPGEHFHSWEYEKAAKRKGGRVYVDVSPRGEVAFHEGHLTRNEARRIASGEPVEGGQKPKRPELTSTLQTYVDLHRHAAVRAALLAHPKVALRLMVAHAVVGSHLWRLTPEPQLARHDEITESIENCRGEADFDKARRAVLALLGFAEEEPTVTRGNGIGFGLVELFQRLLDLPDRAVMDVIAIVIGETLASGSAAVEAVGLHIGLDMARYWSADAPFFALLRDKEVLSRILAEVAGDSVAAANAGEKGKVLKAIIRDQLDGGGGRQKVERWVPRWMAFPPSAYTDRGGVGTVAARAKAVAVKADGDEADAAATPESVAESVIEAAPQHEAEALAA